MDKTSIGHTERVLPFLLLLLHVTSFAWAQDKEELLQRLSDSTSASSRQQAALLLKQFPSDPGLERTLVSTLWKEDHEGVRCEIIRTLGTIPAISPDAVGAVCAKVNDRHASTLERHYAINTLGLLGGDRKVAVGTLMATFLDAEGEASIRAQALCVLGTFHRHAAAAVCSMAGLLDSDNEYIRTSAEDALKTLARGTRLSLSQLLAIAADKKALLSDRIIAIAAASGCAADWPEAETSLKQGLKSIRETNGNEPVLLLVISAAEHGRFAPKPYVLGRITEPAEEIGTEYLEEYFSETEKKSHK